MIKLSKERVLEVKKVIDEMLRIRCINVVTTLEVVTTERGRTQFKLSSTKFNTIPVIHSEIEIVDFGGSIIDGEGDEEIKVYIPVSARYTGNGETLFWVEGSFFRKDNRFYQDYILCKQ